MGTRVSPFAEDDIPRRIPRVQDMTLADMPPEVGLFPLSGVLLFPRGRLPLNVFEPRYVALVEDALATNRLLGLIQPRWREEDDEENLAPPLYGVGTLGRISSFTERLMAPTPLPCRGLPAFGSCVRPRRGGATASGGSMPPPLRGI